MKLSATNNLKTAPHWPKATKEAASQWTMAQSQAQRQSPAQT